jgi:hypothetical protein
MHSQAQWRYLYAIQAPFAHKWAEQIVAERGPKTGYHSLPKNKPGHGNNRTRANKIRAALASR